MNGERILAKGLMPALSPHYTPCTNILFTHWIMPKIILPEFYLASLPLTTLSPVVSQSGLMGNQIWRLRGGRCWGWRQQEAVGIWWRKRMPAENEARRKVGGSKPKSQRSPPWKLPLTYVSTPSGIKPTTASSILLFSLVFVCISVSSCNLQVLLEQELWDSVRPWFNNK